MYAVTARLKVREGELEGFKHQAAGNDATGAGKGHEDPSLRLVPQ
jgi:hypothetical protein